MVAEGRLKASKVIMKQIILSLIIFTIFGRETLRAELGSQKIAALRQQLETCDNHKKRLIESDFGQRTIKKCRSSKKAREVMHTLLNEVCDAEEKIGSS